MRRPILIVAVAVVAIAAAAVVWAQTPGETPFPSPKVEQLFVSAQTVTAAGHSLGAGALNNRFARGETVVFQVFGGQNETGQTITDKDVKYAYVAVPGQPNLKLRYSAASTAFPWTASWTIPATYPTGLVPFKVRFRTLTKQYGNFVQIPVTSAQLTVTG
ncbi:MAG: hypothetical protein OEW31_05125 [Thermoleophilia bacterium]|nr:hypothetical protein [Thermoleophilia bacterium]MDH4345703.1 hypothetical protein [Thermoleophilia bacterium]